jgi:hypothetical protein
MSPADVLAQARSAGVEVLIYDGKLASRGPATAELRATIREHKAALITLLTGRLSTGSAPELPSLPDDDEHAAWLRREPYEHQIESAPLIAPVAWVDRLDVSTVVEDLAHEGMRRGKISRMLGLTSGEVLAILRRTGR